MINKRPVAFLDILGFKDYINNRSLERLSDQYSQIINMIEAFNKDLLPDKEKLPRLFPPLGKDTPWCIKRIFSDAIILIANDPSEESALRLFIYIWRLMQASLAMKMPLRGGIAYDEIYIDAKKEIFIGKALTKAYELESCQQWIGIAIHEDLVKAYKSLFSYDSKRIFLKNIFLKYPVPFKGGARKNLHTINWRFNFIVKEGTRSLMPIHNDSVVIEKVKNTLEYAKSIVDSGEIYISDESSVPIEVRKFFCGGKPPFLHGDDL